MKQKLIKVMALGLCLTFGLSMTACGNGSSDGGNAGSTAETENTADESNTGDKSDASDENDEDSGDDTLVLTLEDDKEVTLTALTSDDVGIYGYYTCEADGSEWAFGGKNVAVAYPDKDGNSSVYVCSIDFYQTDPDEDDSYYLCAVLNNTLEDTSTCWYVMNALDDDGNAVGLVLQDPGNSEQYIALTLNDDSSDNSSNTDNSSDADKASSSEAE